jgi:hydrogenase/urease accessory protein HupE
MKHILPLLLLGASPALAHPGHEAPVADGAAHWLLQGDHLAVIIAGVVFLWLALDSRPIRRLRRLFARE